MEYLVHEKGTDPKSGEWKTAHDIPGQTLSDYSKTKETYPDVRSKTRPILTAKKTCLLKAAYTYAHWCWAILLLCMIACRVALTAPKGDNPQHGSVLAGIGSLLGQTISSLATGSSQIIRALGASKHQRHLPWCRRPRRIGRRFNLKCNSNCHNGRNDGNSQSLDSHRRSE